MIISKELSAKLLRDIASRIESATSEGVSLGGMPFKQAIIIVQQDDSSWGYGGFGRPEIGKVADNIASILTNFSGAIKGIPPNTIVNLAIYMDWAVEGDIVGLELPGLRPVTKKEVN